MKMHKRPVKSVHHVVCSRIDDKSELIIGVRSELDMCEVRAVGLCDYPDCAVMVWSCSGPLVRNKSSAADYSATHAVKNCLSGRIL